jgi:hypothetical protein
MAENAAVNPADHRFVIRNISAIGYGQGFTLWHYRPAHPDEQVTVPGFFDDIWDMLAPGDMMVISSGAGGQILFVVSAERPVRLRSIANV